LHSFRQISFIEAPTQDLASSGMLCLIRC